MWRIDDTGLDRPGALEGATHSPDVAYTLPARSPFPRLGAGTASAPLHGQATLGVARMPT